MENPHPSDHENQPPTSMTGLRQISTVLNSLPISASNPTEPQKNLSIIGNQPESQCAIGKPPSAIVLDSLRSIAQNVIQGRLMDDQMLETLLAQHFGSQRFETKSKLKHVYGENGYDSYIETYAVKLDHIFDNEMKLYDAVEFLNRPASRDFVERQVARLRVVMARISESNDDLALLLDTYGAHLSEFPPDIVKAVCDKIIDDRKWFPLVSEMRQEMQRLVQFRKSIWNKFQALRNSLLAAQEKQKQLEADPRLGTHFKALPRSQWLPQHYAWWIEDAERMLELAVQNPSIYNPESWMKEISRRHTEAQNAKSQKGHTTGD